MYNGEKNNPGELEKESIQTESKTSFMDSLIAFIKNNKAASVLATLLIIVLIGFVVKMRINESNFNNEKMQLITTYESTIDSLQIAQLEFATRVFSWSVRSELLRNNTENLSQLLTVFVKESSADLVQLITPEDKIVLLSSDKKFEGSSYAGNLDVDIKESMVLSEESHVKIITPVMGFNSMIGVLVVEWKKE
jgi:hypothetical protein